jgi:hypothetical protein
MKGEEVDAEAESLYGRVNVGTEEDRTLKINSLGRQRRSRSLSLIARFWKA